MLAAAIPFPDISPELFSISLGSFTFALRWYALAYIAGILLGWALAVRTVKRAALWPGDTAAMTPAQIEGLMTWIILGIVLGGRLGYVLFYQPVYYLQHPAEILQLWHGGMSFHGGFLGVLVGGVVFCWRHKIPMAQAGDLMALCTPPGLLLGRVANFVNAELWGRPSDAPWAVVFPGDLAQACFGPEGIVQLGGQLLCARHPSQLYEAALEGLVLGLLLIWLVWRRGALKRPGQIMGAFVMGYGIARMIVEVFRQADPQFITADNPLGHVISLTPAIGLSMGQLLSLPMVLAGLAIVLIARTRTRAA